MRFLRLQHQSTEIIIRESCSEEVIDEREYKLGMREFRRIQMDEIKKRLSSIRRKLSTVGRVRLLVGLAVALFFVWLVSPAFHGLAMALYINWPFFLTILVGVVLGGYLWTIGDKDPAKVIVIVAAVAAVAYVLT